MSHRLRRLAALGLWLLLALAGASAVAAGLLSARQAAPAAAASGAGAAAPVGTADGLALWPWTQMRVEGAQRLAPEALAGDAASFTAPAGPAANLGRRTDVVWLRVPLQVGETGHGRWWLSIAYAPLDEVEVYLVDQGRVVQHGRVGDHVPSKDRPIATAGHAIALDLAPNSRPVLLLRVRTDSTMIVPITLWRTEGLLAHEASDQLIHGVLAGGSLCLALYVFARFVQSREPMHGWLALSTLSVTLFVLAYFGLATLYLWPNHPWLIDNGPPLTMLALLSSGLMFVDRALELPQLYRRSSLLLRGTALFSAVLALLFVAGVVGYTVAAGATTVLGLAPIALAVAIAVRRATQRDPASWWLLLGLAVHAVGAYAIAGLSRGQLPYTAWVQHAFQLGSVLELLSFTLVLTLRAAAMERSAEQARREHERLIIVADTDPLTGLLNRRGLMRALQPLLDAATPTRLAAVYLMDLDSFKPVNDRHGHQAGDQLLIQLGERLTQSVRRGDLVARLGGDEFVVVARDLASPSEVQRIGAKLLACCDTPFEVTGAHCQTGMTIGYALAPRDGHDAGTVLQIADAAMYAGKQAGKSRLQAPRQLASA